jgi:hypothetical protein
MALFELDDVFTYQDANDIKRLWASDTAPAEPEIAEVWLDTSANPIELKRYNGTSWETVGELTAADLLTMIKTVDGGGCGLDADMVDGLEASAFVRGDADTSVNANTQWQNSKKIKLGSAVDAELYSDGGDVYLQLNKDNGRLVFKLDGDSQAAEIQGAMTGTPGAHANHPLLRLRQTVDSSYNIGDIHGELQFYTDDPEGNFPGSQAFIRAVTTRANGITKPDTGLSFGVSDSSNVAGEVLQLEGEGDFHLLGDSAFTVGASNDLALRHDGSNSYLANENNNAADLYIQNKSHGEKIIMTCENSSGTEKTLLTLDPQTDRVTTKLNRDSLTDLWRDATNNQSVNPYIQTGLLSINPNPGTTVAFDYAFTTTPRVAIGNWYIWGVDNVQITTASTSSFKAKTTYTSAQQICWIAIGKKT